MDRVQKMKRTPLEGLLTLSWEVWRPPQEAVQQNAALRTRSQPRRPPGGPREAITNRDLGQERQRAIDALECLLEKIEKARKDLEQAQARLEGLVPMTVVWKKKTCGKEDCRCARGVPHGPYPYLVEFKEGKRLERYLGASWSPPEGMVPAERFRALMAELRMRRERFERLLERLEWAIEAMRADF